MSLNKAVMGGEKQFQRDAKRYFERATNKVKATITVLKYMNQVSPEGSRTMKTLIDTMFNEIDAIDDMNGNSDAVDEVARKIPSVQPNPWMVKYLQKRRHLGLDTLKNRKRDANFDNPPKELTEAALRSEREFSSAAEDYFDNETNKVNAALMVFKVMSTVSPHKTTVMEDIIDYVVLQIAREDDANRNEKLQDKLERGIPLIHPKPWMIKWLLKHHSINATTSVPVETRSTSGKTSDPENYTTPASPCEFKHPRKGQRTPPYKLSTCPEGTEKRGADAEAMYIVRKGKWVKVDDTSVECAPTLKRKNQQTPLFKASTCKEGTERVGTDNKTMYTVRKKRWVKSPTSKRNTSTSRRTETGCKPRSGGSDKIPRFEASTCVGKKLQNEAEEWFVSTPRTQYYWKKV